MGKALAHEAKYATGLCFPRCCSRATHPTSLRTPDHLHVWWALSSLVPHTRLPRADASSSEQPVGQQVEQKSASFRCTQNVDIVNKRLFTWQHPPFLDRKQRIVHGKTEQERHQRVALFASVVLLRPASSLHPDPPNGNMTEKHMCS